MVEGTDYGPFTQFVGYVTAGIATVTAIAVTWRGSLATWKPPEEDLPNAAQKGVTILSFIAMVGLWIWATPENIVWVFGVGVVLGIVFLIVFIFYAGLVGKHRYIREVAIGPNGVKEVMVIGGDVLEPGVKKELQEKDITIQEYLKGVAYNVDKVWSRESRRRIKTRMILLFILVLLSGTVAVAAVGFTIQVQLTGQRAAAFLDKAPISLKEFKIENISGSNTAGPFLDQDHKYTFTIEKGPPNSPDGKNSHSPVLVRFLVDYEDAQAHELILNHKKIAIPNDPAKKKHYLIYTNYEHTGEANGGNVFTFELLVEQ